jgi:hypothetical protein
MTRGGTIGALIREVSFHPGLPDTFFASPFSAKCLSPHTQIPSHSPPEPHHFSDISVTSTASPLRSYDGYPVSFLLVCLFVWDSQLAVCFNLQARQWGLIVFDFLHNLTFWGANHSASCWTMKVETSCSETSDHFRWRYTHYIPEGRILTHTWKWSRRYVVRYSESTGTQSPWHCVPLKQYTNLRSPPNVYQSANMQFCTLPSPSGCPLGTARTHDFTTSLHLQ